jgi:hypothetical protein
MSERRSPGQWIAAARIAVAVAAFLPATVVADGGDPTLIHACVKKANGQVRIVPPTDICLPSEASMHWAAGAPANAGGSIMVHGATFGAGGVAVNFVHLGGGIPEYRSPRAGTIRNTRLLVRANSFDGDSPVTLMVNGVATAITAVIPAGSTASIDIPDTVAIVDGDRVAVVLDRGASTSGSLEVSVAYEIL